MEKFIQKREWYWSTNVKKVPYVFLFTAFQIGDQNKQNSDGRAKSGMSISVISKATMDQESNDPTNPQIQNNPGNPKSGVSSQPDGLTTSCLADPALSSLPNGFQSKVWRNSSSVYCKICAASKCN